MSLLTRSSRTSRIFGAFLLALVAAVGVRLSAQPQQPSPVPSSNINMVSGTSFPDGDPYLQRQNEPNAAVSTRNPLHLLAGANDYRTVDLPGPFDQARGFKMAADAWVGLFKSIDGGQNWKSTLLPGFPQDVSPEGLASPIKGREGATDPIVRSGTNGLFYFAGVAFDRGGSRPSSIFVARYMDLNNREAGDPFGYVDTRLVDSDPGTRFLDKVALATDIPRTAATCAIASTQSGDKPTDPPIPHVRTIPAGPVYVAYAAFTGSGATEQSVIMFSRSTNCGASWTTPIALSTGSRLVQNPQIAVSPVDGAVYVSWRRFKFSTQDNAVMVVKSINAGASFSPPVRVSGLRSFDLNTSTTQFRSNGFQTMAIDATGRVYIAWPDRGYAAVRSDPLTGDSRIVLSTSTTGSTWTVPRAIQPGGIGHQLMPAMTFHGGKLRILYYDLREDVSQLFGPEIDEAPILNGPTPRIRHTMDVFVAQAGPGSAPAFTTARISEYASGFLPGSTVEQRMQFNPPNLPMFRQGTAPFMGDYIDLAPSPPFVLNENGTWSYNTGANGSTVSHALWTDNRDVRPPVDGNWANYTPVTSPAVGTQSRFDPTQQVPSCEPGQVGMRNQNIYTARVTDGLFVSVPGNNKQFNGFQRAFVIVAENASALPRTYRLRIENQPFGGQASFLQFGPALTTLDVSTPALSSIARTVFVTAQDQNARITVSVTEVNGVGGTVVTNGLTGTVVLNPDPQNPVLQNPVLQNPNLQNPVLQNIAQGESYNPAISVALVGVPNLQNPVLQNPNLQNPNLQNPSIQNPHLQNPNLQNPTLQNPVLQNDAVANPSIVNADLPSPNLQNPVLQNPNLQNPNLQNPNLQNAGFSDTNWVITNEGNTTASYTVNLLLNTPVPAGFSTQLLVHKTFTTPAADGCELKQQPHTILLANIPNPQFVTDQANPNLQNPNLQNPNLQNPTLALAPGETATVTLRILDPNIFDGVTYDASAAVTPAAVAQSVNTDDVAAGDTTPSVALPLTITTSEIPPVTPGAPINRTLQSVASTGPLVCSVVSGQLPPGVQLSSTGTIFGTPTTPGNYVFTVRCTDAGGKADEQTLSIQVDPAAPVSFDKLWNGADPNWYNPANWSPDGVPAATARVYVSTATTVIPKLTSNVTIRDLFLEPGATLDTNGFTLTVTNTADAGRTVTGAGRTVLTGNGATASGVFSNLEIHGRITLSAPVTTTGSLTLAPGARLELNGQPLLVGGQLITSATTGALPVIIGTATSSFVATGVNVNGLVLNGAPLTINAGALTRFDNVSFSGFSSDAVQLTINNPGLVTHFPMNGVSFSNTPTTGLFVQASDTLDAGPTLILDILGAVPSDGTAFTGTSGGAIVNWIPNPGEANLAVTQTVTPVPSAAGTRLNYAITVTNGGPLPAAGVTLLPGVPLGASAVTASATQGACALNAGTGSCTLGSLAANESVRADVSFIPAGTGALFTTASVTSQTPDTVIANNFHTIAATILAAGQGVDLALTKADSIDPVGVQQPFTYTLTASNHGTTVATNVLVTDHVPAGITISYATSAQGMCSAISSQVLCSFATLTPGESVTMTFNAVGTAVGVVTNQASVTSAEPELTPADNVATQVTAIVATAVCSTATFAGPTLFSANGPTGDVLVGDLNGDGFKDLVAAVPSANSVAVLLGNGTGSFGAPTLFPSGVGTHEGVILDLNNDGRLDIALEGLVDAFVLFGNGSGGFGTPVTYTFGAIVGDVRAGDFNGDGRPDLAITTIQQPNALHILLNNGGGGFVDTTPIPLPAASDRIVVQDVNADGRPDLALSYGGGAANLVSVLFGDGTGGFSAPGSIPFQANTQTRVFGLGDINGDSRADLGVIELFPTSRRVHLLFGNGAGGFSPQLLTDQVPGAFRLIAGDVNADGKRDLALSSGGIIYIALGDGAGGFGALSGFSTPFGLQFDLADLNSDERLDIVSALNQGDGVAVLLNGCNQPAGDLALTGSDSPDPVAEGATLSYASTVTNAAATAATQVTLTQSLSSVGAAGTATASQGTCTISGRLVTCNLGTLGPGASADVQVTFTPSAAGTVDTVIGVGSALPDANPADNTVTLATAVNAAGRQIVVTNINNAGAGSLRQAILDSNADTGDRDTIVFNIPGSGVRTITLLSALPQLTQPVVIDATTQTGYAGTPLIELNGNGVLAIGLNILAGNSEVRGLAINRFGGAGIFLQSNGGNVIEGNFIGTDPTGIAARANSGHGILVLTGSNRIGGPATARNVISGNGGSGIKLETTAATGNLIQGNYVGVNASGFGAIGNGDSGIAFENGPSGNTVGGLSTTGSGNVVSGNDEPGILFAGANVTGNIIIGNRIGTDSLGTTSIPNGGDGIHIASGSGNVIGGTAVGTGNLISGNAQNGVSISAETATNNTVLNNLIGTNNSGTSAIGNGANGVVITDSGANTIGVANGGNVMSGNGQNGIAIFGVASIGNQIYANRIGANFQATGPIGNQQDGIRIDSAVTTAIGGADESLRNVIGGNVQHGIGLYDGASGTRIAGNTIGFSAPLTFLGNALEGIQINNASNTTIGGPQPEQANLISRNGRNGVSVIAGTHNLIGGNRIFGNTALGIDLGNDGVTANDTGDGDTGPNTVQNFPVLTGVVGGVTGTLNSTPGSGFLIEFYGNAACDVSQHGEGETFLGSSLVLTDANGNATIPLFPTGAGQVVTATATSGNGDGDTSEFSVCVTVPAAPASADLSLTMTESADPVAFATPFSYVLVAHNAGPVQAVGVTVSDTVPAGLSIASALATQGSCTVVNQTVSCALGVLAVDASATVTINVTGLAAATVTNSAAIFGEQLDPVPGNNSDSEQTTIELASCSAVTFTGPTPYAGSPGPMAVVRLVDMNHDGKLDAVATHEINTGGVDVFLNDGAGHFGAPRFTSTGTGPWLHVVADFNGDTHPDVITATDRTAPGNPITLRLLTNDGTGTLTLVPSFSIPFGGSFSATDIDRDGDQDLVIATPTDDLALLRNGGQANFAAPETILADASGFAAFGDFNGDNRTDIVAPLGASGFAVVLANTTGGFLPPVVHAIAGGAHAGADPVDLNGDGHLDLLIIPGDDNGPTEGASVVFGDGAGGFGAAVSATDSFVYWPTLSDVNGDGRPDLVAISSLGSFGVWLGNGGGSFSTPTHFPNAVYYGPVVGDLNGDGRPDIATGDINGTLNVFLNNCGAAPANLGITVAESADPVNEGDELTYTVTLTNHTVAPATGVRLTSVLAQIIDDDPEVPNVTVVGITSSAGGSLSTTGTTYIWTVPTLAANGTATFTFRFRPLVGGPLQFTTGVSSDGTETDPSDNVAYELTSVNATGSTLAVTTTADSGPGSLRQAIDASNADSGDRDTIVFNIPGGGVPTITLQSGLPFILEPVVIDGTTQPTSALVELNGNGLPATGLVVGGGNSIVRGLVINRFNFYAITLEGNGGSVVEGNLIGTDPTGNVARPNGAGGIGVFSSANNRIGGLTPAARNVISGNQGTGITLQNSAATGNLVQGNYIGINAAGTSALPNTAAQGGITLRGGASGNTIGGAVAGAGNVVSGHPMHAVTIINANTNDNIVQGNFIGTDPTGMIRIANGATGIGLDIVNAQRTIVGGPGLARNVISGNGTGIQMRTGASGTVVQNNYIGVNAAGTAAITNGLGVLIQDNAIGNTVGGTAAGTGNVISGNAGTGITVQNAANGNTIQGNIVGLDAGGGVDLGNTGDGINLNGVSGTTIGGTTSGARNVISGNNNVGIRITGATATSNVVRGNYIGVNAAGGAPVGNSSSGITIQTSATGNTIGGTAAAQGNVISGNLGTGITVMTSANANTIQGNLIGVNAAGTQAFGNSTDGIRLNGVSGTIIGETAAGAGNVLSGNGAYGINNQAGSTGTVVYGNRIGTNAAGSGAVPNGLSGMFVDGNGTTIGGTAAGAANVIANNGTIGVNVVGGTGHAIVGNSIFSNGELGINLGPPEVAVNDAGDGDAGPNNNQNYPVLAAAPGGVQGTFNSTPNATFTIHYYGNTACDPSGNGEGQTFLGGVSVTTDANGNAPLPLFTAGVGLIVTATATSATNDTSELSSCVTVPASADLSLTKTDSADPIAYGQSFNYVLTGHNFGPVAATGVVITDTLPAGLSIGSATSSQGDCTVANQIVTCTIGTLAVTASATVTIGTRALTAGVVTNSASISSTVVDPVPGNNSVSEQTTIQLAACTVPTFSAPVPVAVPTYDGIFSDQADLNGDGVNDLVVSMLLGGLAVRLNNGSGGFGPAIEIGHPAPLTFDNAPRSFALGDLNGDGKIDIAVATGSAMEVLIGAGNGSFSTPVPYALGALEPLSAQVVDLDKDGDLDVVLDSLDDNDRRIQVFRNTGGGVFAPVQLVTMAAVQPAFPVIGDFNGDGFPDFAAGSWQHVLSIVLADGNGGYLAPIAYNPGPSPVVAGDVTGDGKTDLIVQGDGSEDFRIWIGDGTGHFTPGAYLGQGVTAVGTRLVDINRDGLRDLVAAHPSLGTVAVQLGQAGGTFAAPIHYASPFQFSPATILDDGDDISGGPSVGDLNGDGQLDIAYTDPSGFINVLFSTCGQPAADLSVTAQDSADPVAEGTAATYAVTVTNHGPGTASGTTVNLAVGGVFEPNHPALAHFTAATGATCTVTDQAIACALGNLASGQSVNLQATVATASGSTITLTASAASNNADPTPGDNTDFETTVVSASGRNLVVTNTNESGAGSLQQAIIESNSDIGDRDTIVFNIPGAGVHTIILSDGLPAISQPVVIDGKTQPGAGATPVIELNGNSTPLTGLLISGGNSIVRGLAINRFGGGGISLFTGGGNTIEGNFIGTNPSGTAAAPNNQYGILVQSANNRIDGTTLAGRNVISGNQGTGIIFNGATANNNVVLGNYIGLNAAGSAPLANTQGILLNGGAGGNTIGGSGTGNVISGNGGNGINIQVGSNGNIIRGNTIGLNAAGAAAVANTLNGISLNSVSGTTIGGTLSGTGNVIAGNTGNGIIAGAGTAATVIQGNRVGTNAGGTASLPNGGHGVSLNGNGTTVGGTAAGAANIIANNGMVGVRVNAGTGHAIVSNSIFANASLGIDLGAAGVTANDLADADTGANNLQNFPVLTAVPGGVTGTLNSIPASTFTVQFFGNTACDSSANGEGQTFLGSTSVTTDSNGNAAIPLFATAAGTIVTATAISSQSDTSEFSACATVLTGPASFTVSTTNDSGAGSLRQAILNANASVGTFDTITFSVPGPAPFSIALQSALPVITDRVTIDGTTQPGYAGNPLIELNGASVSGPADGLRLAVDGNVVRGLVINRVGALGDSNEGGAGISIQSANNTIQQNYIGTDVTGTLARPNRTDGIQIDHPGNLIGGTTAAARNVISGNGRNGILLLAGAASTTIQGNIIGLASTGMTSLGNVSEGILVQSASNVVGGDAAGAGNVISGNGRGGVTLSGTQAPGNIIAGNLIGTNRLGSAVLANSIDGVYIPTAGNRVGGTLPASRNVISGNGRVGVFIDSVNASSNRVEGNYIGTDVTGTLDLGNAFDGVNINGGTNNTVGGADPATANLISGNGRDGVLIQIPSALGNRVSGNSVFDNDGLGIDLVPDGITFGITANDPGDVDNGPNGLQNFPVLVASTGGVDGSLNSRPDTTYRIEYFGSTSCDPTGNGEGQFFLGTEDVLTDANGNATVPFQATGSALFVTATATSSTTNDTSEFSNCVQPAAITREWISNAGGNWEDPSKWSGGVVPQPGEVVIITGAGDFTVTVQSADVSLNTLSSDKRIQMVGGRLSIENIALFDGGLTMAGGVLTGPGILALGGTSSWTGGTFEGAGSLIVTEDGHLAVNMPGVNLQLARLLQNLGTITWNTAALTLNGHSIINHPSGVLEFLTNLTLNEVGAGGGQFINAGTLSKTGSLGPITITADQGTIFSNFGAIRLRLGTTSDAVVSNRPVQLGGSLELVLEPGFDPPGGTEFDVIDYPSRTGSFQTIHGAGRVYTANYESARLAVTALSASASPLGPAGLSAGAPIETFTPGFGRQPSPVTFNGLTYSSPAAELVSDIAWPNLYPDWPNASKGAGLYEQVSTSQLQIDFSTPVRKVGMLVASEFRAGKFILKAYDDGLNEIGTTTATMPGDRRAVFIGLQAPVNIRRIVLTEPLDDGFFAIVDDIRYEGAEQPPNVTVSPSPATFAATLAGQTRDLDVVVTNTGGGAVTVTPSVSSGAFTLPLLPTVCAGGGNVATPGSPCAVRVRFSPTAVGPASGTLTLNTTAGQFLVLLSGTGLSPLAVAPTTLAFPETQVGQTTAAQAVTLTNNNPALPIAIGAISVSANFLRTTTCGATLAAGQSCSVSVSFAPTAVGQLTGTVTISSNAAGSPHAISLSGRGTAGVLTLTPPSLNFGNQLLAIASASQNISVQNTGNLPVTLTAVNVSGDFSIATNSCPGTLAVDVACTVGVRFTPTTTGSRTGSLTIQSSALGSPSTASLTGVGIAGTLSVPASLNLGNQQVGTVGTPSTVAVSNTSALPVTVGVVTVSPAANFIIGSNTCTGTLAGGASCAISVQFTPTTIGHLTATLTIPSNAAANPHLVALVGDSGPAPEGNDSTVRTLTFFNPAPLGPPNPPLQSSSARATLTFFNPAPLGPPNPPLQSSSARATLSFFNPAPLGPPNPPAQSSSASAALTFFNPAPLGPPNPPAQSSSTVRVLSFSNGPSVASVLPAQVTRNGQPVTLTIAGQGLTGATSVTLNPSTGITIGAPTVSPDGRTVTVSIVVSPSAPQGVVTVVVAGPGFSTSVTGASRLVLQ